MEPKDHHYHPKNASEVSTRPSKVVKSHSVIVNSVVISVIVVSIHVVSVVVVSVTVCVVPAWSPS